MGKMAAALAHVFDTPVAIGASARPAIRRTLPFSDSTAAQATVQDFCRPELPELPAGPWLVSIDAPDGYTGWDDRTGRVRRPNPTRVRDARRRLVCPHRTTAGGARPRYVVECFFCSLVARAELSVTRGALSHSQCQVESGLARVGIDEKIYSFLVLFWQRVQPRVDGWRRAQPVGCDGIRHSRVILSCTNTLLPLRVCPASMYTRRRSCPAGLGSASDSSDDSTRVSTRLFFQSAFE